MDLSKGALARPSSGSTARSRLTAPAASSTPSHHSARSSSSDRSASPAPEQAVPLSRARASPFAGPNKRKQNEPAFASPFDSKRLRPNSATTSHAQAVRPPLGRTDGIECSIAGPSQGGDEPKSSQEAMPPPPVSQRRSKVPSATSDESVSPRASGGSSARPNARSPPDAGLNSFEPTIVSQTLASTMGRFRPATSFCSGIDEIEATATTPALPAEEQEEDEGFGDTSRRWRRARRDTPPSDEVAYDGGMGSSQPEEEDPDKPPIDELGDVGRNGRFSSPFLPDRYLSFDDDAEHTPFSSPVDAKAAAQRNGAMLESSRYDQREDTSASPRPQRVRDDIDHDERQGARPSNEADALIPSLYAGPRPYLEHAKALLAIDANSKERAVESSRVEVDGPGQAGNDAWVAKAKQEGDQFVENVSKILGDCQDLFQWARSLSRPFSSSQLTTRG
ncbi:hypothetical protein JCM10212_004967 [Sporobolomyces blumeae]